ncbi:thermonuclease family protein (plasmid) [Escherichia coli]
MPHRFREHVIRVLDGDTLEILQDKKPVRVRLANIDAPEKKQPFGRWSATQLKDTGERKARNRAIRADRQVWYCILGKVYTADGTEANRWQVRNGAAWVYPDYNNDYTLPPLQRDARALKRGLWADKNPVPPWTWRKQNKK